MGMVADTLLSKEVLPAENRQNEVNGRHGRLTPKQRQILALAALEYTTEEIARQLGREPKTVESHLANIYQKYHVRSRVGAILRAISVGELPAGEDDLIRAASAEAHE